MDPTLTAFKRSVDAMNLQELIDQKAAIEQKIEEARISSKAQVISQIHLLLHENGMTVADLSRPKKISAQKVPVKYRDNEGNTWTGRGMKPRWLASKLAAGVPLECYKVVA